MAKKAKAEVTAAMVGNYKPRLYLDLEGKDVSQVKGLNVGESIEVLVTGKVVALSQNERSDIDDKKTRKTGSISLEGYRVQVLEEEDNEYTKMAKDMDEED